MEVTNRSKGSDLVDRVPEELREVCNIVQEAETKIIPKGGKCEKGKWVWGGFTNSWEKKRNKKQRRKGKIYLTECRVQRIAGRDKVFSSEQCKEMQENNRMGNTRELLKKIGAIRELFMQGWTQQRTEMAGSWQKQKRWRRGGKSTQKNYAKMVLMTQISTMVWSLT